jgi:hypothetical protein
MEGKTYRNGLQNQTDFLPRPCHGKKGPRSDLVEKCCFEIKFSLNKIKSQINILSLKHYLEFVDLLIVNLTNLNYPNLALSLPWACQVPP